MKKLLTLIISGLLALTAVFGMTACNSEKTIVVYTNAFFAPFEYYEGTEIVGVDVEIMELVGKKMNAIFDIQDKYFSVLIDTTAEGKLCDCAAAGSTITYARKEK